MQNRYYAPLSVDTKRRFYLIILHGSAASKCQAPLINKFRRRQFLNKEGKQKETTYTYKSYVIALQIFLTIMYASVRLFFLPFVLMSLQATTLMFLRNLSLVATFIIHAYQHCKAMMRVGDRESQVQIAK